MVIRSHNYLCSPNLFNHSPFQVVSLPMLWPEILIMEEQIWSTLEVY